MSTRIQLCYITDRQGLTPSPLLPHLRAAIRAGVTLIQLREKDLATHELLDLATAAVRTSRMYETQIVINDRIDIAVASGAHGVHLGGLSVPAEGVRRAFGKSLLVGSSCHSLAQALEAEAGGADYVLLGPIFDTPSKRSYGSPLGLERLSEVTRQIKIPVLALGGITVERVKACIEAGATGVAGIRLFQDCASLEDRLAELRAQFPLSAPGFMDPHEHDHQ